MKPIAVFRYAKFEGPGYFATFLDSHSIPWQLIAIDQGDDVPARADEFSGLCLMGGPMSANDPLPWIAALCELVRAADENGIPIIGHCLGGQLMSKAFGGQITRNPVKEIGWGKARAEDHAQARHWLGDWLAETDGYADVFQWHGETFSIPEGAQRLLSNPNCRNQMFCRGPHLAMQCHVEMMPEMIAEWCGAWQDEVAGLNPLPTSVQTPEQMRDQTPTRLPLMRRLADQLYSVWVKGLKRD